MCWKQLGFLTAAMAFVILAMGATHPENWGPGAILAVVLAGAAVYLAGDHNGTDHAVLSFRFSDWRNVKDEAMAYVLDEVDPDMNGHRTEEEVAEALYAWFIQDNRFLAPTDAKVTTQTVERS